jgi:hypothetical protein
MGFAQTGGDEVKILVGLCGGGEVEVGAAHFELRLARDEGLESLLEPRFKGLG